MWRLNIVEYTNRFVDAETICNKTELKRCVAILWCVQAKSASCLQREEKGVLACLVWTVGVRLQVKSSQVAFKAVCQVGRGIAACSVVFLYMHGKFHLHGCMMRCGTSCNFHDCKALLISSCTPWAIKTCHLIFVHNFDKCQPILEFFSTFLSESSVNLTRGSCRISYHTCNESLHYLVKNII